MSLRIEERSSSAAIVRVCLPTDQNDDELPEGGAVALLVRPVKLRELEAEHDAVRVCSIHVSCFNFHVASACHRKFY